MIDKGNIKDIQSILKKIDDEEERKEIIEFIKIKTGETVAKKVANERSVEDDFTDTIKSVWKNMCFIFLELSIVAIIGLFALIKTGLLNLDDPTIIGGSSYSKSLE